MTIPDFIKRAREMLDKATKAPLEVVRFDNEGGYISYQVETRISKSHVILGWYSDLDNPKAKADATLAAHAPSDLATALSALEVAWEALDRIKNARVNNPNQEMGDLLLFKHAVSEEAQAEINRLLLEGRK